mgnify:CR=1 FL=1
MNGALENTVPSACTTLTGFVSCFIGFLAGSVFNSVQAQLSKLRVWGKVLTQTDFENHFENERSEFGV